MSIFNTCPYCGHFPSGHDDWTDDGLQYIYRDGDTVYCTDCDRCRELRDEQRRGGPSPVTPTEAVYLRAEDTDDGPEPVDLEDFRATVERYKADEADVLVSKQADYGPGNIASPPQGIHPALALAVRINDKVQRLSHLLTKDDSTPSHEALTDTALDIANYGTILALVLEGEWPEQQE